MDEDGEITGPWEHDGFNVGIPMPQGVYYFRLPTVELARLTAAAPELREHLANVLDWLEGTEAFKESHGAHTTAVEAAKLLARIAGE